MRIEFQYGALIIMIHSIEEYIRTLKCPKTKNRVFFFNFFAYASSEYKLNASI